MYPGVYAEEIEAGGKPIEGVSTSTAGMVGVTQTGPLNKPTLVTSFPDFTRIFGGYLSKEYGEHRYLPHAVEGFFRNGGQRLYVTRVGVTNVGQSSSDETIIEGDDSDLSRRTGLQTLKNIDQISVVAVPNGTSQNIQNAMIAHCELMNRFAVLDPAKNADIAQIQQQRSLIDSKYAALYYPWINVKNPFSEDVLSVPPSGHICGIYNRSDMKHGVHKAPANEVVQGALSVERQITSREQDILNPLGVNCLRMFEDRGLRVWGARTISSDPLWKYVNVRRLILYLEESIKEGTQWVVFEPNDEKMWARVKQSITQFLTGVWRNGALMGSTPEEAFFVKCDRTTMTQDDIGNGRLVAVIGVAHVKPAEFVIFRIAQWAGGSEITE